MNALNPPANSAFLSSGPSSPSRRPNLANLRRRSNDTSGSGGFDYYWSSAAGLGSSSSTSSLAISPSASVGLAISPSHESTGFPSSGSGRERELSASQTGSKGLYRRSEASLKDLIAQEKRAVEAAGHGGRGSIEYINTSQSTKAFYGDQLGHLESPLSGDSDYSSHSESGPKLGYPIAKRGERSHSTPIDGWPATTIDLTPSPGPWERPDANRTPVVQQHANRPDLHPPTQSQIYEPSSSSQSTPLIQYSNSTATPRAYPSPSSYVPGSGPLRSAPISKRASPDKAAMAAEPPMSAPAWQTDFGLPGISMTDTDGEDTIKGREKRSTLPATTSSAVEERSGVLGGSEYLSPEKVNRAGQSSPQPPPRSALRTQLAGITSPVPNLSFDFQPPVTVTSPLNISPRTRDLNQIPSPFPAHSSSGGNRSIDADDHHHAIPDDDRDKLRQSTNSVASINELTDMLGGAIDEIGLIDSRETPPPLVAAPEKDVDSEKDRPRFLSLEVGNKTKSAPGTPVAAEDDAEPITPGSLPTRGESLSSNNAAPLIPSVPAPQATHQSSQPTFLPRQQHQVSSPTQSLRPELPVLANQSGVFVAKPWPAAMLYGHIKNMKHAGDRAKSYARGINELAMADSGLGQWCAAAASSSSFQQRPTLRQPLKKLSSYTNSMAHSSELSPTLSMYSQLPHPSSAPIAAQHPRTVSSGSEFPMREDSYAAREIHQRVIDPADQPTALPASLPYPQLQQVKSSSAGSGLGMGAGMGVGGGMKASQSTQSMASLAGGGGGGGGKRGFFSALRSKKDTSLGPPTGPVGRKDLKGISISHPEPAGRTSISAPLGPRGPRGGGHTPEPYSDMHGPSGISRDSLDMPYRSSLDTSMSRLTPPSTASMSRSSFETARTTKSSAPPLSSHSASTVTVGGVAYPGVGMVREEDVRNMQDILPHVDRGVLRGYLARHGDQMNAISAYLEDEKNGQVRV